MSQELKNTIYCTIFDDNYLARALALYESLIRVNGQAFFAFFCIDAKSVSLLTSLNLARAIIISHDEFATPDLLKVRPLRSQGEYCWTCKPFALLHLMDLEPKADWVAYVDTDMMFFSNPDMALPGPNAHYLLSPHRFHLNFSEYEISTGKHNAGYVAARSSTQGKQVMTWWRDRCIENCSVIPTETTFADQKYLDQFAYLFPFGLSSQHKGLNLAPWNIGNFNIYQNDGCIYVDDEKLLLFHFQGLQLFDNGTASLYVGNMRISKIIREIIYRPHLTELLQAFLRLREVDSSFERGLGKPRKYLGNIFRRSLKMLTGSSNFVSFEIE